MGQRFQTNIKLVQNQSEEKNTKSVSDSEKEAFLKKYYSNNNIEINTTEEKKSNDRDRGMNRMPKKPQKRIDGDRNTTKGNKFYNKTKYSTDDDTNINFKIDIKSNMRI